MDPVRHGVTDYTMARRAALADLEAGRRFRSEFCDGHPDLLRAARHGGMPSGSPCPICREAELVLVTFAFGSRLARRNGRLVGADELAAYLAIEDVRCFTVEVCLECTWNHLLRAYVGRDVGDVDGESPSRRVAKGQAPGDGRPEGLIPPRGE